MRHIAKATTTAATFAAMIFAGTAMANNTFPCSKTQFWITSMPTVPAGAETHKNNHQISIAAVTLKPRQKNKIAKASTVSVEQNT